jgi:DNA replication protein DnaC
MQIDFIPKNAQIDKKCKYCQEKMQAVFHNDKTNIEVCSCVKFLEGVAYQQNPTIKFLNAIGFFSSSNSEKKYKNANFDDLISEQLETYHTFEYFIKGSQVFFIISGDVGCGKTYFLHAVQRHLFWNLRNPEEDILVINEASFFSSLKNAFGEDKYDILIQQAKGTEFLLWDDLGSATRTAEGDWGKQVIYEIIDARYQSEKKTLITTNLNDFESSFGPRTADRLKNSIRVKMLGKSLRNNESFSSN